MLVEQLKLIISVTIFFLLISSYFIYFNNSYKNIILLIETNNYDFEKLKLQLTKLLSKLKQIILVYILVIILIDLFNKNEYILFLILTIITAVVIILSLFLLHALFKNLPQVEEPKDEQKMVKGVENMQDTTASEILTPRTSLYTIDGNTTIIENWNEILEQEFSRIPVYEDNIDNIIGVLFLKDILRHNSKDVLVKELVRKPYFIPGTKKILDILSEFKKSQNHIAIVIDEYGGTEGIVTIEDILEEIVGEIRDEYDVEEEKIVRIKKNIYEITGDHLIEDVNDELNIDIPIAEDYDTISGYILYKLGKIAQKNDTIKTDRYIMKVLKTDNVKIEKIKLILLEANND